MTRQGRLNCDGRRFAVANLTYKNYVGILSQDRPKCRRERKAGLVVRLHLDDSRNTILYGILDSDDVEAAALDLAQRCIKRRSLSGTGWSGDEQQPFASLEQSAHARRVACIQSELVKSFHCGACVENPYYDLLAMRRGQARDPEVYSASVCNGCRMAARRSQPIRNVPPGDDLDSRDERKPHGSRQQHHLTQKAINPVANGNAVLGRLQMDIARALGDSSRDEPVHESHHRFVNRTSVHRCRLCEAAFGRLRKRGGVFAPVYAFDPPVDRARGSHRKTHPLARPERQRSLAVEIEWARRGDLE